MSRDDGFRTADIDVGILDDPKVRLLVRSTRDETIVARCLVAYLAVVTTSWDRGERVALADAAPAWLTGLEDLRDRLVEVGLVDPDGRVTERAWLAWFGPALERQTAARDRWRRADQRRRDRAVSSMTPRGSRDERPRDNGGPVALRPFRPSVPTSPSVSPSGRSRKRETVTSSIDEAVTRA